MSPLQGWVRAGAPKCSPDLCALAPGLMEWASYWWCGTEKGDGLLQVHFNHSGPGHRRHEQEGATGDPEELPPVWPFWTKVIRKITPLWTIFCPGKPRDHPRGRPCVPARPGIGIICPGIADAFKKMSSKLTTLETQYFEMGHLTLRHFL